MLHGNLGEQQALGSMGLKKNTVPAHFDLFRGIRPPGRREDRNFVPDVRQLGRGDGLETSILGRGSDGAMNQSSVKRPWLEQANAPAKSALDRERDEGGRLPEGKGRSGGQVQTLPLPHERLHGASHESQSHGPLLWVEKDWVGRVGPPLVHGVPYVMIRAFDFKREFSRVPREEEGIQGTEGQERS